MELEIFNYKLPPENIAFYPRKRGFSKLLVSFRETGEIIDEKFSNISKYLEKGSLLILNNTRVFNARIYFKLKNGNIGEMLILKYKGNEIKCLLKPAKKVLKEGKIFFPSDIESEKIEKCDENTFSIKINSSAKDLIKKAGTPPLPPYIKRNLKKEDEKWYQTVYAKKIGSVAAPTAGLHFTEKILEELKKKGVKILALTLHVGIGTFKPIRSKNIKDHKMEEEYYEIPKNLSEEIEKAKNEKRKIIAVGTTTVRALESAFIRGNGRILPCKDKTDLFIYPNFKFNVVDGILTNFHLPASTPLCLVSAFATLENIKNWYQKAIDLDFKFLSYGDAMLIL